MEMKLYDRDGGVIEFESNKVESTILGVKEVVLHKEVGRYAYYTLIKKEISILLKKLEEERVRQWEQGLFKKRTTIAYKELTMIGKVLGYMEKDKLLGDMDIVVMFKVETEKNIIPSLIDNL